MNNNIIENFGIEGAAVPINTTGAAVTGQYVSLKGFGRLLVIIMQGAWAGGTPAVTMKQATAIAGTGEKALSFATMWTKVAITGTTWVRTAVASNTFNLPAVANTMSAIEINATDLDVANGFDCVRLDVASPGANADLICAIYILGDARFRGAAAIDAKVD